MTIKAINANLYKPEPRRRGRPRNNAYEVLRAQALYKLIKDMLDVSSDYAFAQHLHRAYTVMGLRKSLHTCKAILRNLRTGQVARLGTDLLAALGVALKLSSLKITANEAGAFGTTKKKHLLEDDGWDDMIRAKLRAELSPKGVIYRGSSFYGHLLEKDSSPITMYFLDERDVAIDVAEILGLDPACLPKIKTKVFGLLKGEEKVPEIRIYGVLKSILKSAGADSPRVFNAMMVIHFFDSWRRTLTNLSWMAENANKLTEGKGSQPPVNPLTDEMLRKMMATSVKDMENSGIKSMATIDDLIKLAKLLFP